jgi:hypothetical protein
MKIKTQQQHSNFFMSTSTSHLYAWLCCYISLTIARYYSVFKCISVTQLPLCHFANAPALPTSILTQNICIAGFPPKLLHTLSLCTFPT